LRRLTSPWRDLISACRCCIVGTRPLAVVPAEGIRLSEPRSCAAAAETRAAVITPHVSLRNLIGHLLITTAISSNHNGNIANRCLGNVECDACCRHEWTYACQTLRHTRR
jgi:hypothetical protein